jgi:hypothetical protein
MLYKTDFIVVGLMLTFHTIQDHFLMPKSINIMHIIFNGRMPRKMKVPFNG